MDEARGVIEYLLANWGTLMTVITTLATVNIVPDKYESWLSDNHNIIKKLLKAGRSLIVSVDQDVKEPA